MKIFGSKCWLTSLLISSLIVCCVDSAEEIKPNILYFAVFDGHGGDTCARFCNEKMPQFINYWLEREETNLEFVLQNAFVEVNNAFARYLTYTKSSMTFDTCL